MRHFSIIIILVFLSYFSLAQGMQIDVQGSVIFNNSSFIITEAGEDFSPNILSEATTFVSISSGNYWDRRIHPNRKWRIEVNKVDVSWNNNLVLEVKRTGTGTVQGKKNNGKKKPNIHDGTVFTTVTNNSAYFFRGRDFISNIPIAFRISGLSISMGAQDFETDVVFTIYDD